MINLIIKKKNLVKKKTKKRKKKFFFFYNYNKNYILSLTNYKLFINHLKFLLSFINKKNLKFNKKSKKEQYKKNNQSIIKKKKILKDIFYYKNIANIKDKKKTWILLKKKKKKNYLFFNYLFYNLRKKNIGARMGGGISSVYTNVCYIKSGNPFIFLYFKKRNILKYIGNILINSLPGKNKLIII